MRAPIITLALVLWAPSALAEGYRLRADALAQAQAPLGVLSLSGNSQLMPGAEAEAWLWMSGGDQVSPEFDALVASLAYRDPEGRGVARVGRFILSSGALPPIHQDGALGIINLPWRGTVELFAGLPVRPRFGERNFNWLAGGRLGQAVGPVQAGLAYYQRRDDGALADHELAFDAYTYLFERFSLAVRASADLINFVLSPGTLTARYDLVRLRALAPAQRTCGAHGGRSQPRLRRLAGRACGDGGGPCRKRRGDERRVLAAPTLVPVPAAADCRRPGDR